MKYKQIISLGSNCHTARDLERMGYRMKSYPFDWVISNMCDVIRLIDNDWEGNLQLQNICADPEAINCYHDIATGIDYYHDFFPDKGEVSEQYFSVKEKYGRRIARFKQDTVEPTIFVRTIRNKEDYDWILLNYDYINNVIKKTNPNSMIIYIAITNAVNETGGVELYRAEDFYYPIKSSVEAKRFICTHMSMSRTKILRNQFRYFRKNSKKKISSLKRRISDGIHH